MNPYLEVLRKYAVFSGRARLSEYWGFLLINIAVSIAVLIVDVIIGSLIGQEAGVLTVLYTLVVLVPSIAVLVRRLHDTGHSAWWLLLYAAPLIGPLVILWWVVSDSQPGPNKYGSNPKGASN